MFILCFGLICLSCYLVGGIPVGYLVGRAKGIDIRTVGSGNIGATNVSRVMGRRWGLLVFVADVTKGLLPVLTAGVLLHRLTAGHPLSAAMHNLLWLTCGGFCILGHSYSVYLGLRGGKGVATSLGVMLGVYPYLTVAGVLAFVVWAAVTVATRYVSLGSVVAATSLPMLLACCTLWRGGLADFYAAWPLLAFSTLAAALVIHRHRDNLARIRAGTERRIGGGR